MFAEMGKYVNERMRNENNRKTPFRCQFLREKNRGRCKEWALERWLGRIQKT